jgi:transcriptional regulator of acetoin/glycerol metabolism
MNKIVKLCRRFTDRALSFLLQGETGVGKDVFARALHAESARCEKPFVAVNCAAIPDTLLDSELFGYAPGTFTGGLKEGKTGKIVASDGGTLFLDEIGDMPLDLQARLLRVLAEREVTPLGAIEPVPVDIKLICATHRNLPELIEAGTFRQDLYYRINGATVVLPPLRERGDIRSLISSIIKEEADAGKEPAISEQALSLLLSYAWPGNIRQLRNVILFALYSCNNNRIEVDDLPDDTRRSAASAMPSSGASGPANRQLCPSTLRQHKDQAERERLIQALERARWRVTKAALSLGISRATVHRKMKEYGILRPDHR